VACNREIDTTGSSVGAVSDRPSFVSIRNNSNLLP